MAGKRQCERCGKNRQARFFAPNGRICQPCQKKSAAIRAKDARLQETYGITYVEWEAILTIQGGVCAICKGKRPTYDVDHSHARETALRDSGLGAQQAARYSVRGILCRRCNRRLLTAALDEPDILRAAADYLEQPVALDVIS